MHRKPLLLFLAILLLTMLAAVLVVENPPPVEAPAAPVSRSSTVYPAISGPQEELTAYTISEGRHFCFPRIFKSRNRPERVAWRVRFAANCDYDLKDKDQKDWNKLCGLFYNLFNTRDNTVMIGWRWNKETARMELCAYYHVDGGRDFTKPLLDVALEEDFQVEIQIDYSKKTYTVVLMRSSDGKRVENSKAFTHQQETCWEINTYFGGNRTAPKEVTVFKGYLD